MSHLRYLFFIAVIHFTLSNSRPTIAQELPAESQGEQDGFQRFPSRVSHRTGTPQKPLIERPGDRNVSSNPARRYAQSDNERAGCPQSISKWAAPSTSAQYTAGYAGGSTRPHSPHSRPRNSQEGTWGLDFSLWGQPKQAWLRWGDGSLPERNGNFETNH